MDIEFLIKRNSQTNFFKVKKEKRKNRRTGKEQEIENFILFEKGFEVFFKELTVITGDNGCGKTTLIKNISFPYDTLNNPFAKISDEDFTEKITKNWLCNEERNLNFLNTPKYIITETELHKNSLIKKYEESNRTGSGFLPPSALANSFDMHESSNGENMLDFLFSLKEITDSLVVLDEPETSLSLKSQYKVKELILEISKQNQIIVITHSEILMNLSEEVYDFESKKYIPTKKYIRQQKSKSK